MLLAACGSRDVDIVDSPGGIYQAGGGCDATVLHAGGDLCPLGSQFSFDETGMDSMVGASNAMTMVVSEVGQSCRRSFCGAGALAARATFKFKAGDAMPLAITASLTLRLSQPVDMTGKTLSFRVFVEDFDTPLHGQMFVVIENQWHQVTDGPLEVRDLWNEVSGLVDPQNPLLKLADGTTQVIVSQIVMQVYLPSPVQSGDMENWTSMIYFDELRWQ